MMARLLRQILDWVLIILSPGFLMKMTTMDFGTSTDIAMADIYSPDIWEVMTMMCQGTLGDIIFELF